MRNLIIKVLPLPPSSEEERKEHILRYKIVTPADVKSARGFYSQEIQKQIPLQLSVEKWRMKHTKSQRGLLHVIIDAIAIHSGMHKDIIKEGIKQQYGSKIEWKNISVPKPSRIMNTVEYGMLINGAILEAAELGINVKNYKREWEEYKRNHPENKQKEIEDLPIEAEYEITDDAEVLLDEPEKDKTEIDPDLICPDCKGVLNTPKTKCPHCGGMGLF